MRSQQHIRVHVGLLLEVSKLSVFCESTAGPLPLLHDISFSVGTGEVLVIAGESGCGKTILSRSLTRLFPQSSGIRINGNVVFRGRDLLSMNAEDLASVRSTSIRYVFQEPMAALNPVSTVRDQLRCAAGDGPADAESLRQALAAVGTDGIDDVLHSYPHQLSAGIAQRVMIAMAIQARPTLVIADEPTSSVDASQKNRILTLLRSLLQSFGTSLLLITHDLGIARAFGDRILVLYKGRVVEAGSRETFFAGPLHPYSQLLLGCASSPVSYSFSESVSHSDGGRDPSNRGCTFSARCVKVRDDCRSVEPSVERLEDGREVRCFYWR
jgi:oligopeptide/dipeptide ABC transporter ATP-binding protein